MNPLIELQNYGQSFWYDNIRRRLLIDGSVKSLIENDGLKGMTSNPSIFDQAIGHSDDYDDQISQLVGTIRGIKEVYEVLAIQDIRLACDLLQDVFKSSLWIDGYVSLEVSPHLARDTGNTIEEALRLFEEVNRPNLMIKVPATKEGIPAIRELIGRGVNINVTLMFSMAHYDAVAEAYISGLESWISSGGEPKQVASVASFFVSRVDTAIDKLLMAINTTSAKALLGKIAVANSKMVYQRYLELFSGDRFEKLSTYGARRQRLLWASTSTKNPDYPDTLYVDELIGKETVNTMPPATIDAFRDHGRVSRSLENDLDNAEDALSQLRTLEIDIGEITEQLQEEGVRSFAVSFDQLLATLEQKLGSQKL